MKPLRDPAETPMERRVYDVTTAAPMPLSSKACVGMLIGSSVLKTNVCVDPRRPRKESKTQLYRKSAPVEKAFIGLTCWCRTQSRGEQGVWVCARCFLFCCVGAEDSLMVALP